MEKSKAAQFCVQIEGDRNGLAKHTIIEENQKGIPADFWTPLGGAGPIAASDPDPPTEEPPHVNHKTLLRVESKDKFVEVAKGTGVKKNMLQSKDILILDTSAEVFAWIGKSSPVENRKHALEYAQAYITVHNKPAYTHIARIIEGGEGDHFLHHFH